MVALSTLISLLISWRYAEKSGSPVGEYAAILLAATLGGMLLCGSTDLISIFLKKRGIETAIHYPIPLHLQPASKSIGYKKGSFKVAEKQAKRILTLPINQFLKKKEIKFICDKVNLFFIKKL